MSRSLLALLAGSLCFLSLPDRSVTPTGPAGSEARVTSAAAGDPSWRHDGIWDDGLAEFCAYAVKWPRYGGIYEGRALLVAVKEPWAPDLEVKADHPRDDGFDVIKLNHLRDVRTGIYAYHQMASAFLRRDDGRLRKLSVASLEACGMSTAQLVQDRVDAWSYWDGQGHRSIPWTPGALSFDALPLALRDFVKGELPKTLSILPSLMEGKQPELRAKRFALSRGTSKPKVPAGSFDAVELKLEAEGERYSFHFDAQAPHTLLLFEGPKGLRYELAKRERLAYWSMKGQENAAWWPASLRRD